MIRGSGSSGVFQVIRRLSVGSWVFSWKKNGCAGHSDKLSPGSLRPHALPHSLLRNCGPLNFGGQNQISSPTPTTVILQPRTDSLLSLTFSQTLNKDVSPMLQPPPPPPKWQGHGGGKARAESGERWGIFQIEGARGKLVYY